MKAITLHQPWATLIALGLKTMETRSWSTKYRGPIAIHAGKTIDHEVAEYLAERMGCADLPTGAVIATATLAKVLTTGPALWGWLPDDEAEYGDFSPGRFAWALEDVQVLPEPIPARGQQGLWHWEAAE